jgi:hypothetical protein
VSEVRRNGDYEQWVRFFLEAGILRQSGGEHRHRIFAYHKHLDILKKGTQ